MLNKTQRNSKRGFALPVAVVVSCFIIIIATILLSLAATSTQKTSADTDFRQAYLNAKSALDYAATYYEGADLPDNDTGVNDEYAEYMVMKDVAGGTTENGADILTLTQSDQVKSYKTYVYSVYNAKDSKITMTAYAKSSDLLGNRTESTTLSVTYDIGAQGNNMGRKLSTAPANTNSKVSSDDVTIHVKQDPNRTDDFVPAIYTWSYYKRTDKGINWNNVKTVDDLTVSQANAVEHAGNSLSDRSGSNELRPAGKWSDTSAGDPFDGPVTKMDSEGNDWFSHTFSPSKVGGTLGMVPWFNMIISRQGANSGSKADGTQTPELLNIWYFDENDRNIYVEILGTFYYYKDQNWDGKTNLQDRIVAYANAPQTVYYVKMEGVTDNSLNPSITVDGRSYTVSYSGYGWWSVRCPDIASNKSASVNITSSKFKNSVSIAAVKSGSSNSIMGNSAYIVIEPAVDSNGNVIKNVDGSTQYTGNTFITEQAANIHMNDEDYVTVYAKVYNREQSGKPTISYKVETHNSSAAKLSLKNAIANADQLYQLDYESTSWDNFMSVLNDAKNVYNNTTLQANSVYKAEETKIDNAKKALKFKEADTTKLQQSYDKALTYVEAEYTEESYADLKYVMQQAKSLLDSAAADGTSVRQESLDNKAIELDNKAAALEKIETYRTNLQNALTNGKTVRDNNPSSMLIDDLNAAIATAEELYNNNSRNKTQIQEACKKLNSVASRIQNTGNIDVLENKITEAQNIISTNRDILVSGTVSNLENVISVINEAIESTVLVQSEIDNYVAKLQSAMDELAYIPQDNITPAVASGKKRVWFDIDQTGLGSNGTNYYIYAWWGSGGNGKQNTEFNTLTSTNVSSKANFKLVKDTISKYYYYDLDEKYTNVIIISGTGNDADQTVDISIGDKLTNNLFLVKTSYDVKDSSIDKRAYHVDAAKLTTVYSSTDVPASWGTSSQYAYVKNSANSKLNTASATAEPMTTLDSKSLYYIKRVAFDSNSTFHICNGTNITSAIKLTTEPFVVRFTDKSDPFNKYDAKSYSDFLKLAPNTDIKLVSKSSSVNVQNMAIKNVNTSGTATVYTDSHVPTNPVITVYFKKPSNWLNKISATLYQYDDSGNKLNEQTNRLLMTDDGNNYYITIDTRNVNRIELYDNNGTKTSLVGLAVDSTKNKYFTAQQIAKSGTSWTVSAYTASAVNISTADVSFDSSCNNIDMAFVGGKKRFFTNKTVYSTASGKAGRTDAYGVPLSSGRLFGGVWNGNDWGNGRVGKTTYSVYYDWYEYKIPAGSSDLYTFQVKGLMNKGSSSNVLTKQIHQVWGDVWISLDNDSRDNGKFKNVSISTTNPDENVTSTSTRIFVDPISSWISSHGGMKVTMWGTEKSVKTLSQTYDGRYYIDVPNNMPFLQFTSGDDTQILPMTKLQGGDVVRYDYSAGSGGTPAWITYVPAYKALQREITSASSVANGWYIYDYNYSTHESTRSYYPKKLLSLSKSYTPSETADPTSQQNSANTLAQWTIAYQDLYNAISNARMYITINSSGHRVWYPEQASNTTGATYNTDQIKDLYDLMVEAVNEYSSSSASLSKLISLTEELDTLEGSLTPVMTNSAIVILDDVKKWNSNIWLKYKDSSGSTKSVPVTSKNKDGYPLLYINIPSGGQITDVQFYSGTTGETSATKSVIKADEVWVCDNSQSGTKAWVANFSENYFSYSVKKYNQVNYGDEVVIGETTPSNNFIAYFTYETTVTYNDGTGSRTYKILPGAYLINMTKYKSYYSGVSALAPSYVNLYSKVAEAYFSDEVNQGYVSGAPDSDSENWTTGGVINTHAAPYSTIDSINFKASSGTLNGSYKAMNKLVFRWLSTSTLKVKNGTSMNAKEFVFASTASISGGSTLAPEFILKNNTNGVSEKIKITFLTDTTVVYKSATGATISYIIPQGTYESVDAGEVNIFDDNWSSNFKSVGNGVIGGSGDGRYLSNPVYNIN